MQKILAAQPNVEIYEGMAVDLIIEEAAKATVVGIKVKPATGAIRELHAANVLLTPGTFLNGKIFIGAETMQGGRRGEQAAVGLSEALQRSGIRLQRLKTGTTPRLERDSIDFSALDIQEGDAEPFATTASTAALLSHHLH
jgi:tRNA uridine 5-carboxymethylaminomethyl modification enzyme